LGKSAGALIDQIQNLKQVSGTLSFGLIRVLKEGRLLGFPNLAGKLL
jgi:hypothetical protein